MNIYSKLLKTILIQTLILVIFNLKTNSQDFPNLNWSEVLQNWHSKVEPEKTIFISSLIKSNGFPEVSHDTLQKLNTIEDKLSLARIYTQSTNKKSARTILLSIPRTSHNTKPFLNLLSEFLLETSPESIENQSLVETWYKLIKLQNVDFSLQDYETFIKIAIDLKDIRTIFMLIEKDGAEETDQLLKKCHFLLLAFEQRWTSLSDIFKELSTQLTEKINSDPNSTDFQHLFYYLTMLQPESVQSDNFQVHFLQYLNSNQKLDLNKRTQLLNILKANQFATPLSIEWLKKELELKENIANKILTFLIYEREQSWESIIKNLNPEIMLNSIYLKSDSIPMETKLLLLSRWRSDWVPTTIWNNNDTTIVFDEELNAETIVMKNKYQQTSGFIWLNSKLKKIDFLFFNIKGLNSTEPIVINIRLNSKVIQIKKTLSENWQMVRIPLDSHTPPKKIEIKIQNENKSNEVSYQISQPVTLIIQDTIK